MSIRCHQFRSSLLTVSVLGAVLASSAAQANAETLGAWQDYAVAGMTPEFSWAPRVSANAFEPSALDAVSNRTGLVPRTELAFSDTRSGLSVAVSRALAGDTPLSESGGLSAQQFTGASRGLERTLIAPALSRSVSDSAVLTGGVIFAYQQFATRGLGAVSDSSWNAQTPAQFAGSSYGTGVRVSLQQSLGDHLQISTAYQSRIDMTALQNYRGLYSRPGDFDLPAVASLGVSFDSSDNSTLSFDASRVMYSDIPAFTSSALPARFLALVGDTGSPIFSWRDLAVLGVDWTWRPSASSAVGVHYTTRQQPEPEARELRAALADEFSNGNLGLSFTQRFTHAGSLRLAASYAPVQYFLGSSTFNNRNASGDQLELEAVWSMAF